MRMLYFAPSSYGGLADYARFQAEALDRHGIEIQVLCPPALRRDWSFSGVVRDELKDSPRLDQTRGRVRRAWDFFRLTLANHRRLATAVRDGEFRHVLLSAYAEYFAPCWSGSLRRLAEKGVVFGAVVHDPMRETAIGPRWWHARSVADAYSFLRHAFVHEDVALNTVRPMPGLRTTVIPHGPYRFDTVVPSRDAARARLDLPADKPVLLAFGHIRDNKNLHLVIEALVDFPELHLLVAGRELSSGQKPAAHYQRLARELGVDSRCRWHVRYVPEGETGTMFAAADFLCLTYSAGFRSASGVLSAAIEFRKPCLASSGPGPLRSAVTRYQLGAWVEPDRVAALTAGLRQLLAGNFCPRWDDYARDHSWERNAEIVAQTLFEGESAHA